MYNIFIGIDPGLSGGVAIFSKPENKVVLAKALPCTGDMLDIPTLRLWLETYGVHYNGNSAVCYIEKVHSMPEQGVSSSFKFGMVTGMLHGMILTMGIPLKLVTPQAWKKIILAGTDKSKRAAVDYALRTYPYVSLLLTERSTKHHDGIADALGIMEYGAKNETS